MKVNSKNKDNKIEFKNLYPGDVFKYGDSYYMKIVEVTAVGMFVPTWPATAVELSNARLVTLNDCLLVEPIDGEFVVN
jgi:hypothetical protein